MIKYGPDKNGKLRYIEDVATGLKCGCYCPECNALLIAKNGGSNREHHFAHESGLECEHAGETVLHLLAKEVLHETKQITTPCYNDFKEQTLTFDDILTEERFAGGRRADAVGVCYRDGDTRKLYIEFKVSHAVDEFKLNDIRKSGVSCIEYDLSHLPQEITKAELADSLIHPNKYNIVYKWIYAPVLEKRENDEKVKKKKQQEEEELKKKQQIRKIESRSGGKVLHWQDCKYCGFHTNWLDYLKHGELHADDEGYIEHRFHRLKPRCEWREKSIYLIGDENGAEHILCMCPYDCDSNIKIFENNGFRLLAISNGHHSGFVKYEKRYPFDEEFDIYGLEKIWEGRK